MRWPKSYATKMASVAPTGFLIPDLASDLFFCDFRLHSIPVQTKVTSVQTKDERSADESYSQCRRKFKVTGGCSRGSVLLWRSPSGAGVSSGVLDVWSNSCWCCMFTSSVHDKNAINWKMLPYIRRKLSRSCHLGCEYHRSRNVRWYCLCWLLGISVLK